MKKFSIAGGILKRPITVIMMTLIVIGFGVFSLTNLKITLYPSFNIPVIAVSSGYNNVAPEDINRIIVDPIEGALSAIEGVETLEARVSRGNAFVMMRLQEGTDIRKTELKVRKAIDQIRGDLPQQAQEPVIFQFDPENRPIMRLSIDAENRGLDELRNIGLELVETRLERIDGLASAETQGGLERRIYIDVSPMSLAQHNLVPADIEGALRSNNVQLPIGNVVADKINYSVRAESTYQTVEEIANTIVTISENDIPIRVKDVAEVSDDFTEITSLVKVNGKNSVSVDVQKSSDANTLDIVNAVKELIPEINEILPPGVTLRVLSDEGKTIEDSINNLSQSALAALIVVIVVILLFMGGWRISLVVASSIPVSIAASFAAMYAADLTLNILTISALALAIGLLVDNSIVVTESIARKLEEGLPRFQAALQGTNEVIGALFGSTLTTLGVFVPIILISGTQGAFFREFAYTICFAIGFSFLSSIILVPVISLLTLEASQFNKKNLAFKGIAKLERGYTKVLGWLFQHKWIPLLGMIAIAAGTFFLYSNIQKSGFPEADSGQIDIDISLPEGSQLIKTAAVMEDFSQHVSEIPEVETIITNIGRSRWNAQSNRGEISLTLVPESQREQTTNDFAVKLRNELTAPGVDVRVRVEGGGLRFGRGWDSGSNRIRLSLIGPEIEQLVTISNKIEAKLLEDPTVISVDNGWTDPTPELHFYPDRVRLGLLGANLNTVAGNLRTQTLGNQAGYYIDEGREIPIEVRTQKQALTSREELFDLEVLQYEDQRVPVQAVGEFVPTRGVDSFQRRDRETILDVNIQIQGNALEYEPIVREYLQNEVILPEGYRYEFTGGTQETQQGQSEFGFALIAALILMFMIMASLFENFRDPFVIWLCIPLAMFGAIAFLYLIGDPLSTTANIGIFMLVGIIVNNGIVLVDYMHLYTKGIKYDLLNRKSVHWKNLFIPVFFWKEKPTVKDSELLEHLLEACRRRMRPILLTAITTICSMIPLSLEIGSGAETWSPLAKAVIGGLMFGSILTLFITPVLSVSLSMTIEWFKELFRSRKTAVEG
ncbi:efflux RND transporter permease subunit [Gracilimonas mengyeensis]|uniref:Hydrophobic/amphiphilic exporter-1, HAE1 family n=1 Tax=Gracilimonas mengyeensis TaxID=1302730 RepID=A0A521FF86_9BACT|nr:efflux RND transporter permease subunit [Gracilimonas mengyeensis]SMO94799.1 hydrophobic/amphiphilic exporter-1, HAE1 family [Gracilimonas mengyeensis]